MKKVAIVQSNYIPWKGYFDMIAAVDEFILYDDMQFTKNDWRNRNQIKTPQGTQWLTVPVGKDISRRIRDVALDSRWQVKHWKSLESNYRRAPHFDEIAVWLEPLYMAQSYANLSQMNRQFIEVVCSYLGIKTVISNSWDYTLVDGKIERLVDLCRQAGGTEYISGPAAKDYIEERVFTDMGIKLSWFDYSGYSEYPQLWGEFTHGVTILDLLFNCGMSSPNYMRHVTQ
ncbi:WbqC family protein [Pseudomonas paeninsulae]|uniref:WbqC family protein n=1 Tax=Pseudomonas paeninsulae TaxID=3110772 RepID=UPI002D7819FC|nr:WbqC family protein [Pseudomonas sp. IT1137]